MLVAGFSDESLSTYMFDMDRSDPRLDIVNQQKKSNENMNIV